MILSSNRVPLVLAALMFAASAGAIIAKPTAKLADERPAISLEKMIPEQFGEWRYEPQQTIQVINPQTQELLDKLYSQILSRTYVGAGGYRIMLSLAYGTDQRERSSLRAHKPEVCYPAQGFTVVKDDSGLLVTEFGNIPVRRLFATLGPRQEPLTYWFTVGDTAIQSKLQKRLVDLRYGLTGRLPDGLLFRVSSIDPDPAHAYQIQDRFITQLLQTVSPAERKRLSGLGNI